MTLFVKLADDFTVNWNFDDVISRISNDIHDPNNNLGPYHDPSGVAHWQYYKMVNISFARNFTRNFKSECMQIAYLLMKLQKSITVDNELTRAFINHRIAADRISLIRTIGNVNAHSDVTRAACINIGIRNSNTGKSRISDSEQETEFSENPTTDYVMNDGDVYLINTKKAHDVVSLTNSLEPRYLITYNVITTD